MSQPVRLAEHPPRFWRLRRGLNSEDRVELVQLRRRQPELVGCYDTESEACEVGYRSPTGRRFLIKAVLEEDPVISIPWAVPANRL